MRRQYSSATVFVLVAVLTAGFIASDLHDHPLGDARHDRDCSICKATRSVGAALVASSPAFSAPGPALPAPPFVPSPIGEPKRLRAAGTRAPPRTNS